MKRALEVKSKAFFIIFKGLSTAKNCLRPESASLIGITDILFNQKLPPKGVPRKRRSEIMQQVYRITPMPKCNFNKAVKQLYSNRTSHWCSAVNLLHIFRAPFLKNTSKRLLLPNIWLILYVKSTSIEQIPKQKMRTFILDKEVYLGMMFLLLWIIKFFGWKKKQYCFDFLLILCPVNDPQNIFLEKGNCFSKETLNLDVKDFS